MSDNIDKVREVMSEGETITKNPDVKAGGGSVPPRTPPNGSTGDDPNPPETPLAQICSEFPLNDIGNGKRFVTHFGDGSMFVPRVSWFKWDGRVWEKDVDEIGVRVSAQKISGLINEEIDHLQLAPWENEIVEREEDMQAIVDRVMAIKVDDREVKDKVELREAKDRLIYIDTLRARLKAIRKAHRAHARAAGNSSQIGNMLKESSVTICKAFDVLDADPLMINTQSGVLKFEVTIDEEQKQWVKDGEPVPKVANLKMLDHDPALLLTKMLPVDFDPSATCPLFDEFLQRIQPNIEMRKFLRRWFGLSLTALTGEQKLVFLYGTGSNGKSVMVDLISRILSGYAATAKIETLTGKNRRGGGDATPDLVPLMGARMVRASEPEEGVRFQEGLIKELTGGEPIQVRALHSDFVEIKPLFKLVISGNHKPEIRGTDDGIWRRLLLVPFDVQIPKEERDAALGDKLWAERTGILNWLIKGLKDYLENGLQEPESIIAATQEFREESDPVHAFLCACCQATGSDTDFLSSKDLMQAFNFWLDDNGKTKWTPTQASRKIKAKAGKWKDPRSAKTFSYIKRSNSGYIGIKFTDMFSARMKEVDEENTARRFGH